MSDIASPKNPRIVAVARLHRRRHRSAERRTILEGPHLITEALDTGTRIIELFTLEPDDPAAARAAATGSRVFTVTEAVMDRLAPTEHPRGPVAVIPVPEPPGLRAHDVVVLAGIADPGNAGTLIRSAAAFGHDVVAGPGVDVWSPKVLRAGAGAHFRTHLVTVDDLDSRTFHDVGIATAALVVTGGTTLDSLDPDPLALFVGSEARGLPDAVVADCDQRITLPMAEAQESLNAAVAGSIAMWERFRRRPSGAVLA